ncbi:MAG: hypothetical protein KDE03_12435 [Rhodobacteraceae bacterium]|nr:hypothetical protein [Paracoccaceae bacterium]
MRRLILVAVLLLPVAAAAGDWHALTGAEIGTALSDHELTYEDGARQIFRAGGGTTYVVGAGASEGRWRVEGDRYCSNWQPSSVWSCYTLERDAEGRFRFSGGTGDMSVGSYSGE